jgi:hypothetical protein
MMLILRWAVAEWVIWVINKMIYLNSKPSVTGGFFILIPASVSYSIILASQSLHRHTIGQL